ncbi:MAG TPA: SDR family oxidoreductase [Chloroflexota bacterium]|jgi:uncharacterized protein YbjT (DUF2867 family)
MLLVTGATGLNGGAVVRQLSARGVPVRALVRNPSKAAHLTALAGVEVVEGDMARPTTLAAALRGVERAMLISSSDPAMLEVQSNFIDAARGAGVEHVVKLSGIMPEVDSDFRFARMHGLIEQKLEQSGMAYTHLRAGEFMHAYFRQVPSIVSRSAIRLPMAEARIASIDVADIAEVAAMILTSSGHAGQIYPLTGPEALTMAEVAQQISVAIGKPVRYEAISPDDYRSANLAAGMPTYTADALVELYAERRAGKESHVYPWVETLLGRRPCSFQDFATRHAEVFRGA